MNQTFKMEHQRIANLQILSTAFSQELVDMLEIMNDKGIIKFNIKKTFTDKNYKSTNPFQYLHRQNMADCKDAFEKIKKAGFTERYIDIISIPNPFLSSLSAKVLGRLRSAYEDLNLIFKTILCEKVILILNREIASFYKQKIGAYQLQHHINFEKELKRVFNEKDPFANKELNFNIYDKLFERMASESLQFITKKIEEICEIA